MQSILDAITEWIKEILIGAINGNLSTMFGDVNEKVGTIAAEVGQTPQGWNAGIFNMIRTLSENVIVPIAGLVITYVLCVELISMVSCCLLLKQAHYSKSLHFCHCITHSLFPSCR